MTTPSDIESLLERDEGTVLHVYKDSKGYWTLGTGRLVDERRGGGITEDEARYLLRNDITKCNTALTTALPWFAALDEVRHAVLISMAFQMGVNGLLEFVNTLAAVRYGDYAHAAAGMLASKWAREDSPERAERLAEMMKTGEWR